MRMGSLPCHMLANTIFNLGLTCQSFLGLARDAMKLLRLFNRLKRRLPTHYLAVVPELMLNHCVLQSWVGYVLGRVLGRHSHWQYVQRSERWDVAAASLQVLCACLQLPSGTKLQGLAASVRVSAP